MKMILLGDLHLGARNGSSHFSTYFNKFFTDVLFPYMKKNKITHIIQLGDLFDNRTNLSYKAFHACKDIWFKQMGEHGFTMEVLIGNHDTTYRHTLEINSPELLLGEYKHIDVITSATQKNYDGMNIDIIPWLCDENMDSSMKFMQRADRGEYCVGHFEISGFQMQRGVDSHGGISPNVFDGYAQVISGHYHTKSSNGNILYTGIPYEITWSDYADPKGFYVLDTKTKKNTFVRNPLLMFEKIIYKSGSTANIPDLAGKIIKVVVQEKEDPIAFERFVDSIRLVSPYDMTIVEGQDFTSSGGLDEELDVEDTPGIISNYITGIDTTVDKESLQSYIMGLYNEAITLDDRI
jgi:DNA repair exonuclease SbcCD nuclease subunit